MSYNLKPLYENSDELETKDKAISVMYGRVPDEFGGHLVPITVNSEGRIVLGTGLTLSTDNIDIGDVVLKGISAPLGGPGLDTEQRLGVVASGGGMAAGFYSLLTQDPRFTFQGATPNQNLNVFVAGLSHTASQEIFLPESTSIVVGTHATWGNVYQGREVGGPALTSTIYDLRGHTQKFVMITNTGAASCLVRAYGSIDFSNYDIPIQVSTPLLAGASLLIEEDRPFMSIRFQIQRDLANTTVSTKGYAI